MGGSALDNHNGFNWAAVPKRLRKVCLATVSGANAFAQMARALFAYEVPVETITYLIDATVNGPPERRLGAKLLLDCLRQKLDVAACLDNLKRQALLDVADVARGLAAEVGLVT